MSADTIIRKLPVPLTETEQTDRAKRLARRLNDLDVIKANAQRAAQEYKSQAEETNAEIFDLRQAVTTGTEERDVQCELRFYPSVGEAELVRLDTGAVVETRPMTKKEHDAVAAKLKTVEKEKPAEEKDAGKPEVIEPVAGSLLVAMRRPEKDDVLFYSGVNLTVLSVQSVEGTETVFCSSFGGDVNYPLVELEEKKAVYISRADKGKVFEAPESSETTEAEPEPGTDETEPGEQPEEGNNGDE